MRVVFTEGAADQFDEAVDYILARNPQSAARVRADIEAAVDRIATFPLSGRQQDEGEVRKVVSQRYGYRLFYEINEPAGIAIIVALLHPAQQS